MKRIFPKPIFLPFMLVFLSAAMLLPASVQAAAQPKLNKTKATVYVGGSVTLKVKNASGKVRWNTKDRKTAAVSSSGKVTGKKPGKTIITAKVKKKSLKCTVFVKNPFLNAKSRTLELNKTFQLKLTGAKMKSCTSSDKTIASVTGKGKITAKKAGRTVISVKASNKNVYKCTITVKKPKAPEKPNVPEKPAEPETPTGLQKDFSDIPLLVRLSNYHYVYTGEAIEPDVTIIDNTFSALKKDVDYIVNYTNNVNVGKAHLTISGIGKYKGKLTKEFEIEKAGQDIKTDWLSGDTIYVGKTKKINVFGAYGTLEFQTQKDGVVQIGSDGTITGAGVGQTYIYLTAEGDENHQPYDRYPIGLVNVINEDASSYGFDETEVYDGYKYECINSRKNDGANVYQTYFICNSDENWLDGNVSFEAEDVTPAAYANMFNDMDIAYEAPTVTAESAAEYIRNMKGMGHPLYVQPPCSEYRGDIESKEAVSGKYLTVKAGAGVRVVKLTAKRDGKVLDYIYLSSDGKDAENNDSSYDLELYKQVRRKVEDQLWTDDMSNLEKLQALGRYISETTHYTGEKVTRKEYNPTFWKNWSVEDKVLFLDMSHDLVLNEIMVFQGGLATCTAAGTLYTAATEDLGLPSLPDDNTDITALGEGVRTVFFSSGHVSLEYQSADGTITGIDTQGLGAYFGPDSEELPCEIHGCREKIISLK